MEKEQNEKVVLEFRKDNEGIGVIIHDCSVVDVIIGIAETIQLIMEGTNENKENILADISSALEILEKEEEK